MFDPNVLIAIAAIVVIISLIAVSVGSYLLGKLVTEHRALQEKVHQLEELQPKRLTHNTAAGLEDEIAILRDVLEHLKAYQTRVGQALDVARTLRADPRSYDPDRPAGQRLNQWD